MRCRVRYVERIGFVRLATESVRPTRMFEATGIIQGSPKPVTAHRMKMKEKGDGVRDYLSTKKNCDQPIAQPGRPDISKTHRDRKNRSRVSKTCRRAASGAAGVQEDRQADMSD